MTYFQPYSTCRAEGFLEMLKGNSIKGLKIPACSKAFLIKVLMRYIFSILKNSGF